MARGKHSMKAAAQIRMPAAPPVVVELDTRKTITDEALDEAIATYESVLDATGEMRDAIAAVLRPYIGTFADAPHGWLVVKDATVGMYGGPVRFHRGQKIDDMALAGDLRRAGVDLRPAV